VDKTAATLEDHLRIIEGEGDIGEKVTGNQSSG